MKSEILLFCGGPSPEGINSINDPKVLTEILDSCRVPITSRLPHIGELLWQRGKEPPYIANSLRTLLERLWGLKYDYSGF